MPLPSPYRNPGRWRAVVFQQEVRHGTAGCLLSGVLVAPVLVRARTMATRSQGNQRVRVAGSVWLILLLVSPLLLCFLRFRPLLLAIAAFLYVTLVLPQALNPQMPQASALWFPRSARTLLVWGEGCLEQAVRGMGLLATQLLKVGLQVLTLPFILTFRILPWLHHTFVSLHGLRTITNQAVFFLLVEELVAPETPLTALHTLLLYTLVLYVYHSLYLRQWGRGVGGGGADERSVAGLTAWWAAGRLGKGVATSCVLVMFTTLRAAHLHPHPHPAFIITTLLYFVATLHSDSEPVWAVWAARWMRRLGAGEVEDFWVWAAGRAAPMAASVVVVAAAVVACRPWWLAVVAVYTNVVVPWSVLVKEVKGRRSPRDALALVCRRPTTQEVKEGVTCPVCLEKVVKKDTSRVTPCQHLFHSTCLSACLDRSPLCPLCRQRVLLS
ncbi:hypothetical protein Pcinc_008122 [Petrolisthes cinctipes]|uniref:RING-type domain-containing protein n=1 Tax=Petrolisthes cinctipes TaxID=88211 RepID=A0AAE1G9M2_PETCI|nr:hypothetical protein Pcinc_008122 [Petrolisthes cinctipes]